MIRILIADDHILLREGLKQVLQDEFDDIAFGEAGSGVETLQKLKSRDWNVLILDIIMPDRSGMDILQDIHKNYPKLPVLVLSSTPEDQLGVRVIKAGAWGFLNKQAIAEDLVLAINKLLSGGRYISPTLAERLAADLDRSQDRPLQELLSPREYQIFKMMATGQSVKEIADELSRSVKTVSTFRSRVFEKLHLKNDMDFYQCANKYGLLNQELTDQFPKK